MRKSREVLYGNMTWSFALRKIMQKTENKAHYKCMQIIYIIGFILSESRSLVIVYF